MTCEFGDYLCTQNELVENRLGIRPRIIVEGPQGSGKTSLVSYLGTNLGYFSTRGFPSSEFILNAQNQAEICVKSISQVSCQFEAEGAVFDRSPISQFAWMAKHGSDFDEVYSCTKAVLSKLAISGPLILLFVDSDVDACTQRQDMSDVFAISKDKLEKEVEIYKKFCERLLADSIPGVICREIKNTIDKPQEEFLNDGLILVKELSDKKQNDGNR
ncbi:MAG TPA: hypothetical protein VLH94_04305 [Spirochaetia bacterium]|nr:hypothetical protein [Spirochaetia bacterium]